MPGSEEPEEPAIPNIAEVGNIVVAASILERLPTEQLRTRLERFAKVRVDPATTAGDIISSLVDKGLKFKDLDGEDLRTILRSLERKLKGNNALLIQRILADDRELTPKRKARNPVLPGQRTSSDKKRKQPALNVVLEPWVAPEQPAKPPPMAPPPDTYKSYRFGG